MPDAHKNFAVSLVATAPSPATSGTSLVVTASQGTRFPAVPFNGTIGPPDTLLTPLNSEIVRVTAIATDTLTFTRAQESSSARTVVVGDQIAATVTAKTLTDAECGFQFDYVEKTSDTTVTATTEAGANTIVTANAVTYDGSTVIEITFFAPQAEIQSAVAFYFILYDGSSAIGRMSGYLNGAGIPVQPQHLSVILTPSAASHTYSVRAHHASTGTSTIRGGSGGTGAPFPVYIRQRKV